MNAGLRSFLSGMIDYAGLFPPAKLPLEEAIRNYARYRTEPESWMLGRFICPVSRLHELHRVCEELFRDGPPVVFSALGRGGESSAEFLEGVRRDVADIDDFQESHVDRVLVDVYETKLSEELIRAPSKDGLEGLILSSACRVLPRSRTGTSSFFEATPLTDSGTGAQLVIAKLRTIRDARVAGKVGFKVRCGGLEATAFPSTGQLAGILANRNVTFKCTAGLHHPIRRWDAALRTLMHGFINVFAAGMLAEKHNLDASRLQTILEDEDARSFSFSDSGLRWKDLEISTQEIALARQSRMTSFGSCSFDEPREDLCKLGWL